MRSHFANNAEPYYPARIYPILKSFADEICGTLARLIAYVGTLALLGIGGIHLWDRMPVLFAAEPAAKAGWSQALRSRPAFVLSQLDMLDKTETYEIFRHPEGGRRDVFHWAGRDERPVAELEIYRPGGEFAASEPASAGLAAGMALRDGREPEAAGIIDSKFGPITLFRRAAAEGTAPSCLGFVKSLDEANLRISGWSCQGDVLPAERAAIGCTLNRLILLTSGNEPKLAKLFARAELKRGDCSPAAATTSGDWVTSAENPRLRGAF
jgi:hypothetical protein